MKSLTGKVLIKVDIEQKNAYTFSNGTEIVMPRDVMNLDKKYTWQTLGECLHAENIPKGALILFHHNATHDVNVVFDSDLLTKEEQLAGFKVISIKENECFLWKERGAEQWNPTKGFCTALRVFEPYKGIMVNIPPTIIKNCLFITSGEFNNKVARTLKACDYQITFRNEKGIDQDIIRVRHFEDTDSDREEITCIDNDLTKKVLKKELLIGISINSCSFKK